MNIQERDAKGKVFVKRLYVPRMIGLGLGFVCVASVFIQNGMPAPVWLGLAANGFIWPHIAYFTAKKSRNPYRAEIRNLLIDSFLGGIWIPLMSFNLLPSATVIGMLSTDNISVGGVRLFIKGMLAQLAGLLLGIFLYGLNIRTESTTLNVLACIPMLGVYPIIVAMVTHRLGINLRQQKKKMEKVDIALKEANEKLTEACEELRESEKKYRELSIIDNLTQLYNSRYLFHQLKVEIDRANRYDQPLALVFLDLDNFKQFNDKYGHIMGDNALSRLGQVVKECLRKPDSAYRYGGEEFIVLLPMTRVPDGIIVADRIRTEFKKERFTPVPDKSAHLTMSIGISQYQPQEDMVNFVRRVDELMYQAKNAGKDRICSEP